MIMLVYILSLLGAILSEKMWQKILFGLSSLMIGIIILGSIT